MILLNYKFKWICLISVVFLSWSDLYAQVDDQQLRYAMNGDSVYVYHIQSVPLGDGFNIYRQDEGAEEFQQLNEEPVRGVMYPEELPSAIGGDLYEQVQTGLESEDAADTFFSLRSNSIAGRLYTFVHPEIADALGRLYIDTGLEAGQTVTYRIEFVDDLGQPTGETLEQQFTLEETTPRPTENLEITNDGYSMTAEWTYPPSEDEDDKVIRFEIYQSEPGSDVLEVVNEEIILRDQERTEYEYHFSTDQLGSQMQFMVVAVDITGQTGPTGEIVTHTIEDNIPPAVIEGVAAEYVNQQIEVTWPVSPEPDLAGYRVYKSMEVMGDFTRLHDELIDPVDPIFRDPAVTEGERHFYKVTAVDSAGNESPRSAVAARHVSDTTAPPVPIDLSAEFISQEEGVNLSWTMEEEPADLRRYILLRRSVSPGDSTTFNQIIEKDYLEHEFTDVGVGGRGFGEGIYYEYGVLAADSSRNFSDTTTVRLQVPDLTPPESPANVMANNVDGIRVDLNWNQTTSGDAVSYRIHRKRVDSTLTEIDSVSVQNRLLRDESVELGLEYRYGVSAIDSVGNESEPTLSDTVWVRDYDPPRKVRNVRTTDVDEGIEITWEPVTASDMVGYNVYRSNISTGVYNPLNQQPVEQTNWIDENANDEFWYRVRAVDISGNESRPSEPVQFDR
jgi:fibronectin type 3 domain-containing protein